MFSTGKELTELAVIDQWLVRCRQPGITCPVMRFYLTWAPK